MCMHCNKCYKYRKRLVAMNCYNNDRNKKKRFHPKAQHSVNEQYTQHAHKWAYQHQAMCIQFMHLICRAVGNWPI